ncbi:MAG TPA: hypothetical protein VGG33_28950 [Polyangia bacterium]
MLLRPDDETNNAFVYCLAYAAKAAEVDVVAFVASANHYHAVVVDKLGQIPKFLERFHKLLAKHQNVLRRRWENFWSSGQSSLVELVGPDDVLAKVIYTLTNPVKDHLVERAHHWPGALSLLGTTEGKKLTARRPIRFFRPDGDMPEKLELQCARAPGFEHLSPMEYRRQILDAVGAVESAAAGERKLSGGRILGRKAVLAQSPKDSPRSRPERPALNPRIAAKGWQPRIEAIRNLKAFRAAYAAAREIWLEGGEVLFPSGTWWLRRFAAVPCCEPTCTT